MAHSYIHIHMHLSAILQALPLSILVLTSCSFSSQPQGSSNPSTINKEMAVTSSRTGLQCRILTSYWQL